MINKISECFGGVRLTEVKRIADILFGERIIKIKKNDKERLFEIYVNGKIEIPADMQKRFKEKLQLCRIIPMIELNSEK